MKITLEKRFTSEKIPKEYRGSVHEGWFSETNYQKGKHGTAAVLEFLKHEGYPCREISDCGDVLFRKNESLPWQKAEVKASKVDFKTLKSGHVNQELWFNQIRTEQDGWSHLYLVGVYPNFVKIWYKSREDFIKNQNKMSSTTKVLTHVGTNDLGGVCLKLNTSVNTFEEWELIYDGEKA